MGVPFPGSTNSQVVTQASNVALATGDIINITALQWVKRSTNIVQIRMNDGSRFDQTFNSVTDADTFMGNLRDAMVPQSIGNPFIRGITPATAVNGTTVNAVLRGQGFLPLGTVSVGADAATVTYVDSTCLLLQFLGTAPASTKNVVYTDPGGSITATLTNGFVWT